MSLLLVACGGGGGGASSNSTTIKGLVIDGYVEGATVWLDLNGNGVVDAGEPTATTAKDGSYSLTTDAAGAANALVLAEVPVGAKDDDAAGGVVDKKYVLAAPPGQNIITPLSTLVVAQLLSDKTTADLSAMNAAQLASVTALATAAAQDNYNLAGVDMSADIVKNKNDGDGIKAYNIARAAVQLLQEGNVAAGTVTADATSRATMAVSLAANYLKTHVVNATGIEKKDALNGDAKAALTTAANAVNALSEDSLKTMLAGIQHAARQNSATAIDIKAARADGDFDIKEFVTNSSGVLTSAKLGQFQYDATSGQLKSSSQSWSSGAFSWSDDTPSTLGKYWSYVGNQWLYLNDFNDPVMTDIGNSTMRWTAPNGDTSFEKQRTMKAVNVAGLKVRDVVAPGYTLIDANATFPEGSLQYVYGPSIRTKEQLKAADDDAGGKGRNIIYIDSSNRATTFADVLTAFSDSDSGSRGLPFSPGAYSAGTGCAYFGSGSTSGKLTFRGRDASGKCSGVNVEVGSIYSFVKQHVGTWELVTRAGQQVMKLNWSAIPPTSPDYNYENVLVVVKDLVRYGSYHAANAQTSYGTSDYNRTAMNAVLKELNLPSISAPTAGSPTSASTPLLSN